MVGQFSILLVLPLIVIILCSNSIATFAVIRDSDKGDERVMQLPPPRLNQSSAKVFKIMGAHIGNKPFTADEGLPPVLVTTSQGSIIDRPGGQIIFRVPASYNQTASELFTKYAIPTYQVPSSGKDESLIFIPPTFVIKQIIDNDTKFKGSGFFTLTPLLKRVIPPINILMDKIANPENSSTEVKEIKFGLSMEGESVGFSFAVSSDIPQGLNVRPTSKFKTTLFLNIDYVGQQKIKSDSTNTKPSKLNFSDPENFISSPEVIIGAKKSLKSVKFDDGCPKLAAGLFNEKTGKWQPARINRTQSLDTFAECSYKLQTEHFSKFAVGGVVPPGTLERS